MAATGGARRRSGLGRSLRDEQSPRGAPRNGVPLPLTWSPFGDCRRSRQLDFEPGSRPDRTPGGRGARVVHRRARGNMDLQKPEERTRPPDRSREGTAERSSRCSRTPMKACGGCPAGQRGSAPCRALARALARSPRVEGTSGPERPAALTCRRRERAQAAGHGLLRQLAAGRPKRGVRGFVRRSRCRPTRQQRSSLPARKRDPGWQSKGPKPAARRQARGCRRPDDREVVRRLLRCSRQRGLEGDLEGERRRVFPRRSADSLRR
jgi:hypothetical protein